jgi:hypothetical protein
MAVEDLGGAGRSTAGGGARTPVLSRARAPGVADRRRSAGGMEEAADPVGELKRLPESRHVHLSNGVSRVGAMRLRSAEGSHSKPSFRFSRRLRIGRGVRDCVPQTQSLTSGIAAGLPLKPISAARACKRKSPSAETIQRPATMRRRFVTMAGRSQGTPQVSPAVRR